MAALSLINSGACLDDDDEPAFIDPPGEAFARDVLRTITDRADLIGRAPDGRAFLLLELDPATFSRLTVFGAELEELEPEQDDDTEAEPSASPIHPIDQPNRTASRSAAR